jgi:hypothetical protein
MTFSWDICIWLAACLAGLLTSAGSLRYSVLILRAVRLSQVERDVLDGARHLFRTELERVIGWSMFVLAGVLSIFEQPPQEPVVVTTIGTLILWLLIATAVLWSFKTASDYLYSRQRFRALPPA